MGPMISIGPPDSVLSNPSHRYVYDILSKKRNNEEVDATALLTELLADGRSYSYQELISSLKALGDLGLGTFIVGRHGSKTRFRLPQHRLISLDKVAELRGQASAPSLSPPDGSESHTFKLRPDFTVEMRLPTNFTRKEAERLSIFLRALPRAEEEDGGISRGG